MKQKTMTKELFRRGTLCAALGALFHAPAALAVACDVTGTVITFSCDATSVNVQAESASSSLTLTDFSTASLFFAPRPAGYASQPSFDQVLNILGSSVINNAAGVAINGQSFDQANRNIVVNIGADAQISSIGGDGAVWIRNDVSGDITIANEGTVDYAGIGAAISATTNDGNVTLSNAGVVTATGGARGVYADGGFNSSSALVSIVNTGTVTADAAGLRAVNYNGLASIDNSATVSSTERQALVAWSSDGPVSITNSGSVSSTADIAVQAASEYGDITVTNSGLINAPADAAAAALAGRSAMGISAVVDMVPADCSDCYGNVSVTNTASGEINALGDYGIEAQTPDGNIVLNNAGTVRGASGVYLNSLSGTVNATNTGSIYALDGGGSALHVEGADSGTVSNSGLLYGVNNAVSVASGATITVNNAAAGRVVGGLSMAGGSFSNSGLLALKTGVDASAISSTGNVTHATVAGDFVQTASGTLMIAAQSANASTGYSTLSVGGSASMAGTLYVDVKALNSLAAGETLSGVVSAGSLSGNFDSVVDNSAMFNFLSVATTGSGGHIDLAVVNTLTAEQAVTGLGATPAIGAARVLDQIIQNSGSHPGMSGVIQALGSLETEGEVGAAVSQTVPLMTGGTIQAAQGALGGINRIVQARIGSNRGLSSGDGFVSDGNIWAKTFVSWADQGERDRVEGYKATTYGFVFGADGVVSPTLRLGAAFAYARSDIDGKSSTASQSADVDIYQLIGYGSLSLDERTELNFQAGIGRNSNDGRRRIGFMGVTADSDYDSDTAMLGVGIGRVYALDAKSSLTPSVRLDYTWVKDHSYRESGAGALSLDVDSRSTEALVISAEGKLAHQLNERTALTASLGAGYDTINKRASIVSAFAGAPGAAFVTRGARQDPWLLRGGAGATYKTASGVEITARYDAEYRDDFLNQTASVKANWPF